MNPEELLGHTLRERAENTDYPSTPLADVSTRARRIRNSRRRTTVLAAAAAVAVVAVPGAVWLGRSPGGSPSPADPGSSAPTVSTSQPPVAALEALPRGPEPAVDYVDGATFVGISGEHLALPPGTDEVVRTRGGGLVVATGRPSSEHAFTQGFAGDLALVDDPNQTGPVDLGCGAMHFAFSEDGTQSAYWVMKGCDPAAGGTLYLGVLNTMGESGPAGVSTPPGQIEEPVGVLSGDSVVVNAFRPDGTPDGVWIIGSGPARRIPGLSAAQAVSESTGDVSGVLADGSSALVDAATGEVRWSAPDGWSLGKLSIDGSHVTASHSVGGATRFAILDATQGRLVTDVPEVGGTEVTETAWAEDGSLMLVLDDQQSSAIVRCTLHGDLSRVTPVAANGETAHYTFGTTA